MNERFTTLDQVVKDICEIGGDDYDHKSYGKVLKVCVNTLRGFNLYSSTPYVKTEEFEVMPNNTVLLPKNALDVVRVGKKDRCGEIEEVFYSKDLSLADKYINEPCKCFDAVQQIDTIKIGTGETRCNYKLEDIPNLNFGGYVAFLFPEVVNTHSPDILDAELLVNALSNEVFIGGVQIQTGLMPYIYREYMIEFVKENLDETKADWAIIGDYIFIIPKYNIVINKSNSIIRGLYPTAQDICLSSNIITNYEVYSSSCGTTSRGNSTTPSYNGGLSFMVNINGEWVNETSNIVNGIWESGYISDIITGWRIVDKNNEIVAEGGFISDCIEDFAEKQVSSYKEVEPQCDTNGRCKSCGNFVPTYTTAWYGGWYSSAPIYSRQLAQNNLNLPNSGQAYYEQYTARPYPARLGFYNLDLAKGVMRLTHNFEHGEKVVIIYSTDMVEIEGAKVVAVEWFDMLLYRCKELIWNRNSVDGTRQRQLYEREYTRIKKIYNKTTHEEWRRAIMKVKYSGVKR